MGRDQPPKPMLVEIRNCRQDKGEPLVKQCYHGNLKQTETPALGHGCEFKVHKVTLLWHSWLGLVCIMIGYHPI